MNSLFKTTKTQFMKKKSIRTPKIFHPYSNNRACLIFFFLQSFLIGKKEKEKNKTKKNKTKQNKTKRKKSKEEAKMTLMKM